MRFATLVLFIVLGGIFGTAQIAHADPHAIFYTAIGQQQLFFNVLAALDQADYVETQLDRQNLLQRRSAVPANPPFTLNEAQQRLIDATNVRQQSASSSEPGVSDVLTRLLTLEGNDLYTDYLVRTLGAEVGRRVATNELLRVICDFALGYPDCEPGPALPDALGSQSLSSAQTEFQKARNRAIVTDPLVWGSTPFTHGVLRAFSSGTGPDTSYRREIATDPSKATGPVAYSSDIAAWRTSIGGRGGDGALHQELLNKLLAGAARPYVSGLYDYPFEKFTADSSGKIIVAPYPNGQPADLDRRIAAAQDAIDASLDAASIAASAAERIALQLNLEEEEGVRADGKIVPYTATGRNAGELAARFDLPAAVRVGEVHSLPDALAQLDTSQDFSAPLGVDKPGEVELVNRPLGSVSGAQSPPGPTEPAREGEVAGTYLTDFFSIIGQLLYERFYELPKQPTSPAANIVAGHLEEGALHTLDRITNCEFTEKRTSRTPRPTSGGCEITCSGSSCRISTFRPPTGGFFGP